MNLNKATQKKYNKDINECSAVELYICISEEVNKLLNTTNSKPKGKKLYYVCAEFLIGKLLCNNLINLGLYDEVKSQLAQGGKSIYDIEQLEPEPSLGNGGLGRLAACFMDSVATLGINGDGIGLLYHFGLFRQRFEDKKQKEYPDRWLDTTQFVQKQSRSYEVKFAGLSVASQLYTVNVVGFNGRVNKLNLFDVRTVDEHIVGEGIEFDKTDIKKNLTLFLYPDDSTQEGKALRLYQQYFMVSSTAQYIIDECIENGCRLYDLSDYAVIQLNDTHPTLIIPELIRILTDRGIDIENAIQTVTNCCAYTNHTILAEALEKWDLELLKQVVPEIVDIIKILDKKVREKYKDKSVYIISDNKVYMANMAIHYCFCVNGVAKLHTEILKNSELNNFYKIYPQKFKNITNGITFRRWLLKCNPLLAETIKSYIGDGFIKDAFRLEQLMKHKDDTVLINKLLEIKHSAKLELCNYIKNEHGYELNPDSIFDIQIKRLHEYKRQQLNGLYIIYKYLQIKQGVIPKTPITFIFGAKAAPSYVIAKDIIHLLLCLMQLINNDQEVNKHIKVFFAENYNVTFAEKLIPACDISEQISLASKEASGTGNMKLMLNGAVTLGTDDGANVEIHNLVGGDNIYIFGAKSNEVIENYKAQSYCSKDLYESDETIQSCVDFITCNKMLEIGDEQSLSRIKNELINKDWFMTLLDFKDYITVKDTAISDYDNRLKWGEKMLVNIAKAGYFSSDRTIKDYNREIWKLNEMEENV